jgi:predicted porin
MAQSSSLLIDILTLTLADGAIIVATDWWAKDGVMLPLKATWKWYTPDRNPDAFTCMTGYSETELFGLWPGINLLVQYGMYGTNPKCGERQRNTVMNAAAQCINTNFGANTCTRTTRAQPVLNNLPETSYAYVSTPYIKDDVDHWTCTASSKYRVTGRLIGGVPYWRLPNTPKIETSRISDKQHWAVG